MSTPRTDRVYESVVFFTNEDEASEAVGKLRDLARELEEELNEAANEKAAMQYRIHELQAGSPTIMRLERENQELRQRLAAFAKSEKDSVRLEWLSKTLSCEWMNGTNSWEINWEDTGCHRLHEAIDAAMEANK